MLESFRLARQYFPNAKLGINEFSVTNNPTDMGRYMDIIRLLQAEDLIDTVGVQGHAFSTRNQARRADPGRAHAARHAGLPIYVTELDIDGPTDEVQLADYQRIFPAFWEHPGGARHHAVGLSARATGARRRAPTSSSPTAPSGRRCSG